MLRATRMSRGVREETLFLSDKITHTQELGASKPTVTLKERAGTQVWDFYSEEGENKQKEERNETVLHGRIELAGYGDIRFNTKHHESRNSQLFCHKHSASRHKYRGEVRVVVYLWMYPCLYVFASAYIKL